MLKLFFSRSCSRRALAMAVLAGGLFAAGCETSGNRSDSPLGNAGISVETATREVMAGDTVTFTARTRDTYGRDANVYWTTTAGSLKTEQDGRIARVRFAESGTYTVKAALQVEGVDVDTDEAEIRVRPIN